MEPEADAARNVAAIDGPRPRQVLARPSRLVEKSRPGPTLEPAWLGRGVWFFVALGLIFRTIRYAQNLPLWSDECFLAVNFIQRGFLELLQPLENGQIAPLLFLWIERAAVLAMGFSEWSLRLVPLACGLASVLLFERLATSILNGLPLLLAVGVFAVSVHPIRHAAEAKPYAPDLFVALVLLGPAVGWLSDAARSRPGSRRFWTLAVLTPFCLAFSNPAVFVLGGIVVTLAGPVWRSGRRSDRLALASCAALMIGASAGLYGWIARTQSAGALSGLQRYWASGFPPIETPWRLPGWLLAACTGSMFAYPGGGARGLSAITFVAFVAGAIVLTRQGKGRTAACLIAPFGLTLAASVVHRYPFGTEARLMQFVAPAVCLLSGAGAGAAIERIRSVERRRRVLGAVLVGLIACGVVPQVVSSTIPYRMRRDQEAREFARRFWPEQNEGAELACAHLDFAVGPPGGWRGKKSWYLCNQAIYSPQRRNFGGPRLDHVSADHPLRCVVFDEDPNGVAVQTWLERMRRDCDLRSLTIKESFVTLGDTPRKATERWRIYEFVPRTKRKNEEPDPMKRSHNER